MARRPPPRPTLAQLEAQCVVFNAACPVGSPVIVKLDGGETRETTTTSEAQVLSGHSSVIWLKGISGCYLLDRVTLAPPVVEMKHLAPGESVMDEMLELGRQRGYPSQRHAAAIAGAKYVPCEYCEADLRRAAERHLQHADERHAAVLAGVSLDMETPPLGPTISDLITQGHLIDPSRRSIESLIPAGWVFNSADFSLIANGYDKPGHVCLIRSGPDRKAWNAHADADVCPLHAYGYGKTFAEAIQAAIAEAHSAGPVPPPQPTPGATER